MGGTSTKKWDVFLSHSSHDLKEASDLTAALTSAGLRVFLANQHIHAQAGSVQWSEAIDAAIDSSASVIVLATASALDSRWVSYEWRSVHEDILAGRDGMLLPICLKGPGPYDLPRALRRHQCVDCRTDAFSKEKVLAILMMLRGYFDGMAHTAPPTDVAWGPRSPPRAQAPSRVTALDVSDRSQAPSNTAHESSPGQTLVTECAAPATHALRASDSSAVEAPIAREFNALKTASTSLAAPTLPRRRAHYVAAVIVVASLAISLVLYLLDRQRPADGSSTLSDAREALRTRDYSRACKGYALSLEAGGGLEARLGLGACRERQGQLVLALSTYEEALRFALRSKELGGDFTIDRIRAEITSLKQRIPSIIFSGAMAPQLSAQVDGNPVDSSGQPIPLDPGTHEVRLIGACTKIHRVVLKEQQQEVIPANLPGLPCTSDDGDQR